MASNMVQEFILGYKVIMSKRYSRQGKIDGTSWCYYYLHPALNTKLSYWSGITEGGQLIKKKPRYLLATAFQQIKSLMSYWFNRAIIKFTLKTFNKNQQCKQERRKFLNVRKYCGKWNVAQIQQGKILRCARYKQFF